MIEEEPKYTLEKTKKWLNFDTCIFGLTQGENGS